MNENQEKVQEMKDKAKDAALKATEKADELYNKLPLDEINRKLEKLPVKIDVKSKKFRMGGYAGILVLLFLVLYAIFSGGSNTPSAVTEEFFKAVSKGDLTAVKKYATDSSAETAVKWLIKPDSTDAEDIAERKSYANIKIISEYIGGEQAQVSVRFPDGSERPVGVRKVDGKWKVAESFN